MFHQFTGTGLTTLHGLEIPTCGLSIFCAPWYGSGVHDEESLERLFGNVGPLRQR